MEISIRKLFPKCLVNLVRHVPKIHWGHLVSHRKRWFPVRVSGLLMDFPTKKNGRRHQAIRWDTIWDTIWDTMYFPDSHLIYIGVPSKGSYFQGPRGSMDTTLPWHIFSTARRGTKGSRLPFTAQKWVEATFLPLLHDWKDLGDQQPKWGYHLHGSILNLGRMADIIIYSIIYYNFQEKLPATSEYLMNPFRIISGPRSAREVIF